MTRAPHGSLAALLAVSGSLLIASLLPGSPARALQSDDQMREGERTYCRAYTRQLVPPEARVADPEAFCACYADGALAAGLPQLERAESNPGQEVRPRQDTAARDKRAEKSAAVAAACLKGR